MLRTEYVASPLPPIRAEVERIERITVCTRPFRASGPRIERVALGDKVVVHNYGHGGSGWSLSWGSAALVRDLLRDELANKIVVLGCGALGLTTARTLQRAGARVRIVAREFPPQVRSSRATGSWTPDARVALDASVGDEFQQRWERIARTSFEIYRASLAMPGEPVKVVPRYVLSEEEPEVALRRRTAEDPIGFAHLESRIADLWPAVVDLEPQRSPFAGLHARRAELFRFDITAYSEHLVCEFLAAGGTLEQRSLASLDEARALPESVVVNCTGYGARALLQDESVLPIRGQIGWLPAQPEAEYSLQWKDLNVVARPDGVVVQLGAGGDGNGWMNEGETADPDEAAYAVRMLAALQARNANGQVGRPVTPMETVKR